LADLPIVPVTPQTAEQVSLGEYLTGLVGCHLLPKAQGDRLITRMRHYMESGAEQLKNTGFSGQFDFSGVAKDMMAVFQRWEALMKTAIPREWDSEWSDLIDMCEDAEATSLFSRGRNSTRDNLPWSEFDNDSATAKTGQQATTRSAVPAGSEPSRSDTIRSMLQNDPESIDAVGPVCTFQACGAVRETIITYFYYLQGRHAWTLLWHRSSL